eukprot:CAMPEP_0113414170 /NCGR_PEP_ID=MMETSP0013_2-20120614/23861_1 /TAXON_ID=2843 ORGANISM="Skeletonema costatum, Strain 1716" /NCGR_SAMPLE_ID=MMETSP0013_2 /ASSEMBLY_ACC=CAM_ASM_000158 /LENGTH=75 /DNA_ID=CAMNT_0000300983 /DNA_START=221 /DNA_END=445 /DNA_ORIENTATION=+ /assembly_acc=CAM_ASM_000158
MIHASFAVAEFDLCPMPFAHSSFDGNILASFTAAQFEFCTVPPTHSSLDNLISASFTVAVSFLLLCPVLSRLLPG